MADVAAKPADTSNARDQQHWEHLAVFLNSPLENRLNTGKSKAPGSTTSRPGSDKTHHPGKPIQDRTLDLDEDIYAPHPARPAKGQRPARETVPIPRPDPRGRHGDPDEPDFRPSRDDDHPSWLTPEKTGPPPAPAPPRLDIDKFADAAKKLMAKLGHPDFISKDDLARAIQNKDIKGEDAQALAALYKNFDSLVSHTDGGSYDATPFLTPRDLDRFQTSVKAEEAGVTDAATTTSWASKNLSRFATEPDPNSPGTKRLSQSDIDNALKQPNLSADDKTALEFLRDHFKDMSRDKKGLNTDDVEKFDSDYFKSFPNSSVISDVMFRISDVQDSQNPDVSRDLYADKNDPTKSIVPDAVRQGSVGDCYFEAALAAVAKTNPELIKNAIKDNHDGTYTVTFPGAPGTPVTVKAPTDAELGLYSHGSTFGTWASVMEKAYGELTYEQDHWAITRKLDELLGKPNLPETAVHYGGDMGKALDLLTGGSHTDFSAPSVEELTKAFSTNPPKAVEVATPLPTDPTVTKTPNGFLLNHAFTVLNFKPDGNGGGTVTLRDPHGMGVDDPEGEKTISYAEFAKTFYWMTIEK